MQQRGLMVGFMALAMSAGLVIACGDDDDGSNTNVTPDGGSQTPDSGSTPPDTDAGNPTPDAAPDAPTAASDPITPLTTTQFSNAFNPYGLIYASDGFIYASGATQTNDGRRLAVWRFKDGALDATFGADGVLSHPTLDGTSFDLVEVSAGNFVVQAVSANKVYLVKLTKANDGSFSFDTPVFVRFGYDEGDAQTYASWGIGLDKSTAATPKIVVFAHGTPPASEARTDADRWITRVDATTLAFDAAFNGGAPYTSNAAGGTIADNTRRGLVLADGSIVSSGYANFGAGEGNHVILIRLLPNGTPDPAFGFGMTPAVPGQTKFNPFKPAGFAEAYNVVRQSNGRYVTTGYGVSNFDVASTAVDLVSFGVKADGLDATYGRQGSFAWQSEGDKSAGLGANPFMDRGRDMAVLPDDRIVHGGVYDDYATIFVTDKDGKPDPNVGNDGVLEYAFPTAFFKVTVSPDGKQIAATTQSTNQADGGTTQRAVLATLKVGQ
ncbi:MAG: delta-60 repeat domain-containing protein [Labilithrix sp.]|nr:delta-60 repeat domain-containing protein [Labilithrix sp.]